MKCAVACLLFSVAFLAGWVFHQFVAYPNNILRYTDYLGLPPEFWSAAFFSLFLAFGLEGLFRLQRAY